MWEGPVEVNVFARIVEPADAFYAMCKLRSGEFVLDPNFKAAERALGSSAEGLLLEGMRRLDEESRVGPPPR